MKHTIKKCLDNNDNVNLALLQMTSTPIATGLPSPATLLFKRPIRALLPQINKEQINFDVDDEHYKTLRTCQDKYTKGNDTCKGSFTFPIGSTVAVHCEDG